MTEEQRLRFILLMKAENVDKARESYDFIMGGKAKTAPCGECELEDGVYLVYKDGRRELFTGENPKDDVDRVGLKVGDKTVGIRLRDFGDQRLPYNSDLDEDDYCYQRQELHALDDFDGKDNTRHLKRHGDFAFKLEDDEWIPSLGELALIFKHKDSLNKALAYIGADEFADDDFYWSSTEHGAYVAWLVSFSSGNVYNYYRTYTGRVRPVAAF